MVVVQTARGTMESQHTRGLTIQLSQGQGRQPLRPEGAPPAAGVPRSHAARAFDGGGRRQDNTPERCVSTEKLCLFCCVLSVPSLDMSFQPLSPIESISTTMALGADHDTHIRDHYTHTVKCAL